LEKLLSADDLVYQGAFRLPEGDYGSPTFHGFNYGGTAIVFNSEHQSLFIVGHDHDQMVAEISIPSAVNSSDTNALSTARVLQPFADICEGNRQKILSENEVYTGSVKIGGLLVYGDKLLGSLYGYFDGAAAQMLTHFSSSKNVSKTGDFQGMFKIGALPAGFVSGYMTMIPQPWQRKLGGKALTGNAALPVISRTSFGPAVSSFNPDELGSASPVPAIPLVYYPEKHPTLGGWNSNSKDFNGTTEIKGVVFPSGSRSVLFFGRHGKGEFCYGEGTGDLALAQKSKDRLIEGKYCYDPAFSSKGTHGYPYAYQVWAYDANDFLAVLSREKMPWDIVPYSTWNITLPFAGKNISIAGVAYDQLTQRIFLSQSYGNKSMPVIHVFSVDVQ
jgi:hypothetical protein